MSATPSNVVAFDDAPFERAWRGDVAVYGAVFAGLRLDGVVATRVRRDGRNATERLTDVVAGSKFGPQLQLVLLQGIALDAALAVLRRPCVRGAVPEPLRVAHLTAGGVTRRAGRGRA